MVQQKEIMIPNSIENSLLTSEIRIESKENGVTCAILGHTPIRRRDMKIPFKGDGKAVIQLPLLQEEQALTRVLKRASP